MQIVDAVCEALGEPRKKPSNRRRAARILDGLSEDYAAYIAELALGRVQTIVGTQGGVKNRMACYFGVLEDLARQAQGAATSTPRRETLAGRYDHLVRR